jgi:hypothetical protein
MNISRASLGVLAAVLLASGAGCQKSGPAQPAAATPPPPLQPPPPPETLAQIHWIGKDHLGTDSNAYYLMSLWALPESAALERQTLIKLSSAPWRELHGQDQATNPCSFLLAPLLFDLVRTESYLEIARPSGRAEECVLAVRLDDRRAGLWETNLAVVMQSLTGTWPIASEKRSWTLDATQRLSRIEMVRAGDWTLVGAAHGRNSLLQKTVDRVRAGSDPFGARASARWLEVFLDLPRLAPALPAAAGSPTNLPVVQMAFSGNDGHVAVRADLTFPRPLPLSLEPWSIPTNRIQEPLISFTAIRGIQPWLASLDAWKNLQLGPPPGQLFFWSPDGIPMQIFMGVPLRTNGGLPSALCAFLSRTGDTWVAAHAMGAFQTATNGSAGMWLGLQGIAPCFKTVDEGRTLLGALLPSTAPGTNTQDTLFLMPSLAALLSDVAAATNLVAFDWELTGPRIESCLEIGEAFRFAFRQPRPDYNSPAFIWVYGLRQRLGNSQTEVLLTAPNQLSIRRASSLGLTGAELNLLAEWLDSPRFPW